MNAGKKSHYLNNEFEYDMLNEVTPISFEEANKFLSLCDIRTFKFESDWSD